MRTILSFVVLIAVATACHIASAQVARLPSTVTAPDSSEGKPIDRNSIVPATHEIVFHNSGVPGSSAIAPCFDAEPLPTGGLVQQQEITLNELVQMAVTSNPAIAQAESRVQALRGQWVQVGLPPNPTAGYASEEMGAAGTAGKQGAFVGQQFITGGKLRLNRAVLSQDIAQAEQRLAAMQLRVETDIRQAFYSALIAQRRIELAEDLLRVSSEAADASQELLNAEEIPRAGLLQTQIEQQNFAILLQTSRNEQSAAWRQLSAIVGTELPVGRLDGDVSELPALLDWDEQLTRLTTTSPEVSTAFFNVQRAQMALERAQVEPIPDLSTQFLVQYDYETDNTIAGVQVGLPLPIWNRNQGGIRQAQSEVAEARRNAQRVELELKRRLALAFQKYANARALAETYTTQILPKSQETYDLVQRGYSLGELGYLDLLTAQRTYSQTNLAYLNALSDLWTSWTEIDGLLLTGSLAMPSK